MDFNLVHEFLDKVNTGNYNLKFGDHIVEITGNAVLTEYSNFIIFEVLKDHKDFEVDGGIIKLNYEGFEDGYGDFNKVILLGVGLILRGLTILTKKTPISVKEELLGGI